MPIDKAIEAYDKLAESVFSRPNRIASLGDEKFDVRKLEKAIKEVINESQNLDKNAKLLDDNEKACKMYVLVILCPDHLSKFPDLSAHAIAAT